MKGEALFQCGGFLDRKIGMEPLVIDWAKEETKMTKIIQHIMFIANNLIFNPRPPKVRLSDPPKAFSAITF